ncbi:TetR/AcrR family transcriptional regulator [Leptolyngbya sp. 15MV]|nr:TetR/AcrR family transcriptional regulator [Leptolyngbya sp. 15MV]
MRKADPELTERRRRQILDAALRCFRESGLRGASVSDICKVAGMSPGHLYHYFPSKEAIVAAIAAEDRAAAAGALDWLQGQEDLVDGILRALDGTTDLGRFHLDGALAFDIYAEAHRNPAIRQIVQENFEALQDRLAAVVRTAQQQGKVASELDPIGLAITITTLFEGLAVASLSASPRRAAALARTLPAAMARLLRPAGPDVAPAATPSLRRRRNADARPS